MRILIVKTVPGELNVSKVTYNHQEVGLARALVQAGNQCDIMCCADSEPSIKQIPIGKDTSITLYCVKATIILKNGFFHNVDHIFKKYDMLHVSEYNQMYTWHIAKKYHNKMVIYHGPYYCKFNKRYNLMSQVFDTLFLKRYLRLNTCFITKSMLAEEYLKKKGIKNVRAIGVGIDIASLSTSNEDRLDFVNEIEQCHEKKIMYIGRIEPRRNVFFLLDILEKLNRKSNVSLILVGSGEKEYVKTFFMRAEEKGILKKIIYKERVEQRYMEQLYKCAEVFLLPTIYDIYGMVLLEAMYFKQCVITTLNGGSNMMMNSGENGFIIDEFSVDKWSEIINNMFENDTRRLGIGKHAHDTIEDYFTWQVLSEKFLDVYMKKLKE